MGPPRFHSTSERFNSLPYSQWEIRGFEADIVMGRYLLKIGCLDIFVCMRFDNYINGISGFLRVFLKSEEMRRFVFEQGRSEIHLQADRRQVLQLKKCFFVIERTYRKYLNWTNDDFRNLCWINSDWILNWLIIEVSVMGKKRSVEALVKNFWREEWMENNFLWRKGIEPMTHGYRDAGRVHIELY